MPKILIALLLALVPPAPSLAAEVEVSPGSVYPGDAFLVKVTGSGLEPVGVHDGGWLNFARCGEGCYLAIGAVDLDTAPGPYAIHLSYEGEGADVSLTVAPKEFPAVELTLPPGKVILSAADAERAEREALMLEELWKKETEKLWEGKFAMPLDNGLSTAFGVRRLMNKVKNSVHTGVDIRGGQGEPIKAANRGRVVLAEELFYGGNTIVLDHGLGVYTVYMHLSRFRAKPGDLVERGQTIGEVGATGRATGPHLHFGLKVGPLSANPLSIMELPL